MREDVIVVIFMCVFFSIPMYIFSFYPLNDIVNSTGIIIPFSI